MVSAPTPSIFDYHKQDYRLYLKAKFERVKSKNPKLSFRMCAIRMKTSPSYLKHVLELDHHVSLEKIPSLAKILLLSPLEKKILTMMFLRDTNKNEEMRGYFKEIINALVSSGMIQPQYAQNAKPGSNELGNSDYLRSVIKALAELPDFEADPIKLAKIIRTPTTPEHVAQALDALLKAGEIVQERSHFKVLSNHHIPNPYDLQSFKIYAVGAQACQEMILGDLRRFTPCDFFMGALPVTAETQMEIIRLQGQMKQKIVEISERDSTHRDRIMYVFNTALMVAMKERPS